MDENNRLVSEVADYLDHTGVAIARRSAQLKTGGTISIEGKCASSQQTAVSMRIARQTVYSANASASIALKASQPIKGAGNRTSSGVQVRGPKVNASRLNAMLRRCLAHRQCR